MFANKGSQLIAAAAACLAVSILLLLSYLTGAWTMLDQTAFAWVAAIRSDWLTSFFHGLTYLGTGSVLAPLGLIIMVAMLVKGYRVEALVIALTLLVAYGLNEGMKAFFARPRPAGFHVIPLPDSYSYPSGHAMVSPAFYLMLAYILHGWYRLKSWNVYIQPAALLLGVLLVISRVYLGVHYASDVLSGFALSLTIYFLARFCYWRWAEEGKAYAPAASSSS